MRTLTKQQGMTMWGVAVIMALIAFFTMLVLKLAPPYISHGKITTALKSLEKQPSASGYTREDVRRTLDRRFTIDDVNHIDLKRDLFFEKKAGGLMVVRIAYEVRVPMAYNITALIEFDDSVEVRGN